MSDHRITLTVNGREETIGVEARTLLVHALREDLDYTGPKVGCESGTCGACTVHLDGDAVKSCTVLAVQAEGREVTTVEGVGDLDGDTSGEELVSVQRALHEAHGLQCGYCTPGVVMTASELLDAGVDTREGIREGLKGNVCRCTGYENVVDAVAAAASGDDRGPGDRPADAGPDDLGGED